MIATGRRPPRRRARAAGSLVPAPRRFGLAIALLAIVVLVGPHFAAGRRRASRPLPRSRRRSTPLPAWPAIPTLMASCPAVPDAPIAQGRVTAIVYHGVGHGPARSPSLPRATRRTPVSAHEAEQPPHRDVHRSRAGVLRRRRRRRRVNGIGRRRGRRRDARLLAGRRDGRRHPAVLLYVSPMAACSRIQPTLTPADIRHAYSTSDVEPISRSADQVIAARTRLGMAIDPSRVITQELAKYTSDAGNHVHLEVGPVLAASPLHSPPGLRILFIADAFAAAGRGSSGSASPASGGREIDFGDRELGQRRRWCRHHEPDRQTPLRGRLWSCITLGNHGTGNARCTPTSTRSSDPAPGQSPRPHPRSPKPPPLRDGSCIAVITYWGISSSTRRSPRSRSQRLVDDARKEASVVVVDFHAEATE